MRQREAAHFAYVDPRNRAVQEEMEAAATAHLKRIGAFLAPEFSDLPPAADSFPLEASVVIPVRNRVRTVADAVASALSQRTDFPFNVIVVDNHSTDGTTPLLQGSCRTANGSSAPHPGAAGSLHRRLLERGDLFLRLRPVCRPARFGRPLQRRRMSFSGWSISSAGTTARWPSVPIPSSTNNWRRSRRG